MIDTLPIEITLELKSDKEIILPHFTGHIAHGLFLNIVSGVDPAAAKILHELNVTKPYSVTPFHFNNSCQLEKGSLVNPAFPGHVCFRFLKDEDSGLFFDFFRKGNELLIFDSIFRITSLKVVSKSYNELERESEPVSTIKLTFRSPTYLANLGSDSHWMFPDPSRVFTGLMRRWNLFTDGKRFSKDDYFEYKNWLSKHSYVGQYDLRTIFVATKTKKTIGFVGWIKYEFKDNEYRWKNTTSMLAKYAEFANVGGNRTSGFGVTNYANH